jgi:hypothetical protein
MMTAPPRIKTACDVSGKTKTSVNTFSILERPQLAAALFFHMLLRWNRRLWQKTHGLLRSISRRG